MSAITRIVDVRIVIDRDDRTRVYVDGQPIALSCAVSCASVADALRLLTAMIEHHPRDAQLAALVRLGSAIEGDA